MSSTETFTRQTTPNVVGALRTLIKRLVMYAYCHGWIGMRATETIFRSLRLAHA